MKTTAIVPVNDLRHAKTRLAEVLSPEERAAFTLEMLTRVLDALMRSGVVDGIAVITPQPGQLHLPPGVAAIRQASPGLNGLLEQGREWSLGQGAGALLVVFADMPLLSAEDVAAIVEMGRAEGTVVLAPDRHGTGTNVMLAHPPRLASFAFGPDSYREHAALATQAGARVETYISTGTALDVDTPDDLERMECERLVAWGVGV